jgi:hypothetical protein
MPALISYMRPKFITKEAARGIHRAMTGIERSAAAVS